MATPLTFQLESMKTPTGQVLIVTDSRKRLRALDWKEHEARLRLLLDRGYGPGMIRLQRNKAISPISKRLMRYFAGDLHALDGVTTLANGSQFQLEVWRAIRQIPVGETRSYSHVAKAIGRPSAFRAVASAIALNPIEIVVPCHRVIGSGGKLGGYSGGPKRKEWLLNFERRDDESTSNRKFGA